MLDKKALDNIPLFVDLDGTLILEDSTKRLWGEMLKTKPINAITALLVSPFCVAKAKDYVDYCEMEWHANQAVVNYVKSANGRKIILATGANYKIAEPIAEKFGFFDDVIASTKNYNCVERKKLRAINEYLQQHNFEKFDYIGNSWNDIPLWMAANKAFITNASWVLVKFMKKLKPNIRII